MWSHWQWWEGLTPHSRLLAISLWPLQTWGQAEGKAAVKCCNFDVVQVVLAKNRNNPQTGLCQRPQPSALTPPPFFWSISPWPVGHKITYFEILYICLIVPTHHVWPQRNSALSDKESALPAARWWRQAKNVMEKWQELFICLDCWYPCVYFIISMFALMPFKNLHLTK